jgi:deoxyribonuclease V
LLFCVDVDYRADCVVAAGVGFAGWSDETPCLELAVPSAVAPAAYEPGQFSRRELPYLLEVIARLPAPPSVVVIDGFVWLGPELPGLGAHLFRALQESAAIVGVAKRPYRHSSEGVAVYRGHSRRPLIVTSVGIALDEAARAVATMHGSSRIPTLLKRVDRLSRDA